MAFSTEFCPPAYREARRREFEELRQRNMTVIEYERRFRELSEFCMHLIPDDHTKKVRFIDGLKESIGYTLSGSVHPTYQSARDAALELERQEEIHRPSRRRSFEGSYSGVPRQGAAKKSHSSGSDSDGLSPRGRFQRRDSYRMPQPARHSIIVDASSYQQSRIGSPRICPLCRGNHSGQCQMDGLCFRCGQPGHIRRDCPYGSGSVLGAGRRTQHTGVFPGQSSQGSQPVGVSSGSVQPSAGSSRGRGRRPQQTSQGRVFAMTQQGARTTPDDFTDQVMEADLILLDLSGLEVVLGMDWLARNYLVEEATWEPEAQVRDQNPCLFQ